MKKILVCGDHFDHKSGGPYDGPSMILKSFQYKYLLKSGLFPIIVPPIVLSNDQYSDLVDQTVGLLLFGGRDVDPRWYNEEVTQKIQRYETRDKIEITLTQLAIKKNKPVFGICRGMELINVALGGSLYQDIPAQTKSPLIHFQDLETDYNCLSHKVTIQSGSFLESAIGEETFLTNSFHHQSIKSLGSVLRAAAHSSDGMIEAIENSEKTICGVQRHPEIGTEHSVHAKQLLDRVYNDFFI